MIVLYTVTCREKKKKTKRPRKRNFTEKPYKVNSLPYRQQSLLLFDTITRYIIV